MIEPFRRAHGREGYLEGRYEAHKLEDGWRVVFSAEPGPGLPTGNQVVIGRALDAAAALRFMIMPEIRHMQEERQINEPEHDLRPWLVKSAPPDLAADHLIRALSTMCRQSRIAQAAVRAARRETPAMEGTATIFRPDFSRKF